MKHQLDTANDLLKAVATILQSLKVPYFVTGGFAVSIWGRPRFTADIDLVVALTEKALPSFITEFSQLSTGSYFDKDQVISALRERGEFNFIEPNVGIKVDFWVLGDTPYDKMRLKRRKIARVQGQPVAFTGPEDLILSKLLWWRESGSDRHLADAQSVIVIQKKLDWRYLQRWGKKLKVFSKLKEMRSHGK